ncbi:MAG TPA: glycosyltransferase family 2 protein [Candidatus Limnocylindria bacterium]|jgi:cellulose synthase/poly-beta-1,6-N-acetylglucosamine synthase-like glycosyltransferase
MSDFELARGALIAIAAATVLLPNVFLAGLALASFGRRQAAARTNDGGLRLSILIAAHDEERGIETTLRAIAAFAGSDVRAHVVADNCVDATATVAAAAGACVHVRSDLTRTGKAAALNWLSAEVFREDPAADAFVFIDADARPDPGFFEGLRAALAGGADVVQAVNLVLPGDAALTRLRQLAFHLKCELRPLAYERLGLSVGIHGNGMSFRRSVAERYRWNEGFVAEDGEMHLRLVSDGIRVRFAPDAVVRSAMPHEFRAAAGQALRWERGKSDLFRAAGRAMREGIVKRDVALVVAAADAMIPPLSFLIASGGAVLIAGLATGDARLAFVGLAALAGTTAYLVRGAALARIAPRAYVGIVAWAVPYVIWKVAIYLGALAGSGRGRWAQARPVLTTLAAAAEATEAK